jgi:hypothetical protein
MHLHLPKPLHGWREFAGEVGIIVLGVLIALGAEQMVETLHWRSKVAEFRSAEDTEMSENFAAFQYRVNQSPCVARRIDQLHQLEEQSRAGAVKPFLRDIGRPSIIIQRTSVWAARGEALEHMSLPVRLNYSRLYDLLDNAQQQITAEREAWRSFAAFNGARALSGEDRMRLNELLYRAKSIDWVLRSNWRPISAAAADLKLRPDFGANAKFIPAPDAEFCKPLLAS